MMKTGQHLSWVIGSKPPRKLLSAVGAVSLVFGLYVFAQGQPSKPPESVQDAGVTVHHLHIVSLVEAGKNRWLWSVPERKQSVYAAPPQWWVDAIPAGDTIQVGTPSYPDMAWGKVNLPQLKALMRACAKRHITVKLVDWFEP